MRNLKTEPQIDAGAYDPQSDGDLFRQFTRHGDQETFAQLLVRHGPYLLGVCRRVTAHAQDAEDVFQAAFLELVRNRASISRADSVAGWLQTVVVRLGHKARARRARRQQKEGSSMIDKGTVTADDVSWGEVRQVVDEEVARLPDELRGPIILCLFEGRTQEEAGAYLKMNPRTIKARVARARELLQKRLMRRGISLAALGALLAGSNPHVALSAPLLQATLRGAIAVVKQTAVAGVVSPSVLVLTSSSSLLAGWGIAAATVLGLALSAAVGLVVWESAGSARVRPVVRQSFLGGQFDDEFFEWSGPTPESYVRREDEGLRIKLPAENGPIMPVGVKVRPIVRGDFEAEAAFEFLDVPRPETSPGAGVTVYFFMDDDEWHGLYFGKMNDKQRGPVFISGQRVGKREERITKFAEVVQSGNESGIFRLRVVREGALFKLYAAEGTTGDFQHVQTTECSSDDLRIVRFATDWGPHPGVPMDVRLLSFDMTVDEFIGYKPLSE